MLKHIFLQAVVNNLSFHILVQAIATACCSFLIRESYGQATKQLSKKFKRKSEQVEDVLSSLLLLPNQQSSVITALEHHLNLSPEHLGCLWTPNSSSSNLSGLNISYPASALFFWETSFPHDQICEELYNLSIPDNALIHTSRTFSFNLFHESLPRDSEFFTDLPQSGSKGVYTSQESRSLNTFLLQGECTQVVSEVGVKHFKQDDQVLTSMPTVFQVLLTEKERQIQMLASMIGIAITRPGIYAETYQNQRNTMLSTNSETSKYDLRSAQFSGGFAETVQGNQVGGTQHNYASTDRQTLAEAAAEIQKLLKQLEETNPTATKPERQDFINLAIPLAKRTRILNALEAGGKAALEGFLDNPYLNVAMAVIEGWRETEL